MLKTVVSAPPMYQLKVALLGITPEIWRRILVPPDINLGRLSRVIQYAMGWENCHCHEYVIGKVRYSLPYEEQTPATWLSSLAGISPRDERKFRLNQLVPDMARAFHYEYDFGDAWMHEILFEDVIPSPYPDAVPTCTAGKRACPPDDCGGTEGYYRLLKLLKKPRRNRERRELLEWLGEEFDPACFDLDTVNEELHELPLDISPYPF